MAVFDGLERWMGAGPVFLNKEIIAESANLSAGS